MVRGREDEGGGGEGGGRWDGDRKIKGPDNPTCVPICVRKAGL